MTIGSSTCTSAEGPAGEFFGSALAAARDAEFAAGAIDHVLGVGHRRIVVRFAGPAIEPILLPALAHIVDREPSAGAADLTVHVFDSATTGVVMPAPPWPRDAYGAKGEIAGFNDCRIRTVYDTGTNILHMCDLQRGEAIYWVAEPARIPWWETSFPFRTLIHWWAAGSTLQPTHAAAVGIDGAAILLAGNSGAGKSTSTLACLTGGLHTAGDDFVLVDTDALVAHSLYGTAKLEGHNIDRFPELVPLITNPDRLETEKAILMLEPTHGAYLDRSLPLVAIALPRVTGLRDTMVGPISAARALSVLAPTTSFHLPGFARETFTKLNTLVRSLPCFELAVGTDLAQIPEAVTGIIAAHR